MMTTGVRGETDAGAGNPNISHLRNTLYVKFMR